MPSDALTESESLLGRLFNRINYERQDLEPRGEMKLDGIRHLAELLGRPETGYPIIHVAGTKGKGSVTNMIGSVLRDAGVKTGVYTSPHLESFHQRYTIDGHTISEADLNQILGQIWTQVDECDRIADTLGCRRLTFFDIATATAFLYFKRNDVRAAVVEVGLGGRLDSTNICCPVTSVITTISYDHCRQLGNTLGEIAREKAGIIKPRVPVVCGVQDDQPRKTISQIAAANQSPLFQLGRDFHVADVSATPNGVRFSTSGSVLDSNYEHCDLFLPLLGRHQATNAGIAIASLYAAQKVIGHEFVQRIAATLAKFQHPGRTEIVQRDPLVIIDVAHNLASVQALSDTIRTQLPPSLGRRRVVGILAISRDKDQIGILKELLPLFDVVICTQFMENPRATPVDQLVAMADRVARKQTHRPTLLTAESPAQAWQVASALLNPSDVCIATGSVFLIAELRPLFAEAIKLSR